jgi:hypothetical protein
VAGKRTAGILSVLSEEVGGDGRSYRAVEMDMVLTIKMIFFVRSFV